MVQQETNLIRLQSQIETLDSVDVIQREIDAYDRKREDLVNKINAQVKAGAVLYSNIRNDFDRIELVRAYAGLATLRCSPFTEGNNIIRMNNGQGFIICSLDKESYQDTKSAYTTPLNLEFRYGYRTSALKPIKISKITTTS